MKAIDDKLPAGTISDFDETADTVANVTTVGSVTGAVGSVTAGVTVATNNDKEGFVKNAARANIEFLMVNAADHVTPETGLAVSGFRSIDGGAFTAVSGTIAEVGNGIYQFDALAADMNGDMITFRFTATGADDTFLSVKTS